MHLLKSWRKYWKREFSCRHLRQAGEWQRKGWDSPIATVGELRGEMGVCAREPSAQRFGQPTRKIGRIKAGWNVPPW